MRKERIGVFLSARNNLDPEYVNATHAVGKWIGEQGLTLCYGGSSSGLMEVLAKEVKNSGGRCLGVVPQIIVERDLVSEYLDIEIPCVDLHDRKAILLREADIFVALPGGIGTLDEIFTLLGGYTIGIARSKRIILYNVNGCWDMLLALLEDNIARGFACPHINDILTVVSSIKELTDAFNK